MNAEQISNALDGRRVGADKYVALCPSHSEKSPSFSLRQDGDQVLVYCFGGCSQSEVIGALQGRGLWSAKREPVFNRIRYSKDELEYFHLYCLVYRDNAKKGASPTAEEDARFRRFSDICYREGVAYGL